MLTNRRATEDASIGRNEARWRSALRKLPSDAARARRNVRPTSVHERPNTIENRGVPETREQDGSTIYRTRRNLQNLHPGSNPGGASKFAQKIESFVPAGHNRVDRYWTEDSPCINRPIA